LWALELCCQGRVDYKCLVFVKVSANDYVEVTEVRQEVVHVGDNIIVYQATMGNGEVWRDVHASKNDLGIRKT